MSDYDLVSPDDAVTWAAYHEIRRRVLFEARGRYGVYDPHRPDETAPGHFPRLLLYAGDPIGVVRIDVAGSTAILRRVAIRADVQRRGHGRMLIALVEQFAKANGCHECVTHAARDAVEFYRKCGFALADDSSGEMSGNEGVCMRRQLY
jgi:GNAT superfamily N-acetyltransferase